MSQNQTLMASRRSAPIDSPLNAGPIAAEIGARVAALPNHTIVAIRKLRREFQKRLAKVPAGVVVGLANRLISGGTFPLRFVAYELVAFHRDARESLSPSGVVRLGRGLDSWEAVDTFAPYLAGPAWRERRIPDALVHRWARSDDRWWRRAALVSTTALNSRARGGSGDSPRTLRVCEILAADRDDMVVKALSWALRVLAARDRSAVERFVARYRGTLAPRVIREVDNKLRTGLKNPTAARPFAKSRSLSGGKRRRRRKSRSSAPSPARTGATRMRST